MLTSSLMIPLGTPAPNFSLFDVVQNQKFTLESFSDKKALLVFFTARHCPYAQHIKAGVSKLGHDYSNKSLGIIAICSSDIKTYPLDSQTCLRDTAEEEKFSFPLCSDENQVVAKAFMAACTPDFFLYDQNRKLVYRGQFDSSRPGSDIPVSGKDLRAAIDAVLNDQPVNQDQKPSHGCNIKWKSGEEPEYFNRE